MNNTILQLKIIQRLNKLASNDYDNIECWQVVEAFNKAQVEWCRRQLRGYNISRDGDEQSIQRIDDLEILLKPAPLPILDKTLYYEGPVPADYLRYKRVSVNATSECCADPRRMTVYIAEEANRDILLRDVNKRPDFEWAETFATLINSTIRIYTNNKFDLQDAELVYYRQPVRIQILNCTDPFTGVVSTVDVISEFKDDIMELMIDDAVSILAGDIESGNQFQRGNQSSEKNN